MAGDRDGRDKVREVLRWATKHGRGGVDVLAEEALEEYDELREEYTALKKAHTRLDKLLCEIREPGKA